MVHLVIQVCLVQLKRGPLRENQVCQEDQVHLVVLDQKAHLVCQDLQVLWDHLVIPDRMVFLDLMDQVDKRARPALQGKQAGWDFLDLLVRMAPLEHQVFLDLDPQLMDS